METKVKSWLFITSFFFAVILGFLPKSALALEPNECRMPWGIDVHDSVGISDNTYLCAHHCADDFDENAGLLYCNIPIKTKFVVEAMIIPSLTPEHQTYVLSRLQDIDYTTVVLPLPTSRKNPPTSFSFLQPTVHLTGLF